MKLEKFINHLKVLVEYERKAEIEAMRAEMKRLSGREREKVGRAILGLNGKIIGEELGYFLVKYGREREIKTEIGVGDLVVISKRDPLKSDLVGTVVEKGKRFITVALETVPEWALKGVRLDLYANDITFKRWIENLEHLHEGGKRALEFYLGLRDPEESEPVEFDPIDKSLNASQRRAISQALGSPNFFLIHGPFGTGKTRTLAELIRQEVERGHKVLATAESNVAVDNLVERLAESGLKIVRVGHPSRVSKHLHETTLAYLMTKHDLYGELRELRVTAQNLAEKRDTFTKPLPKYRRGLTDIEILALSRRRRGTRGVPAKLIREMANWIKLNKLVQKAFDDARKLEERIAREIIQEADVVLTTNASAGLEVIGYADYDVAIIDEATQATIPSVLIPINRAKRFVLAGDHRQLPPTILSEKARELSRTLFEGLIERYPEDSAMLTVQYRMNERLMEFPNREFYDGKIKAAPGVKCITLTDLGIKCPNFGEPWDEILKAGNVLVFIDTSKHPEKWERQRRGSESRENPLEARIVAETVEKLLEMGVKPEWIGVITPYDDQRDLISSLVPEEIEVKTVDGYQGREKEVIILSFVRSNERGEVGFLKDLRRLNVSLTRAKRKLIVVGDSETLSVHSTYKRFIEFVKAEGRFVEIGNDFKTNGG
ncbi:IGHMBP2 family helicase [Thermococcus sp. GR7]|uniref:IGHMBP2 family helicase n=1 Tax=unclassified Thermococcus TaxID=2627626 RepID=UPI00143100A7|nr:MULTISPECIES: IGHMBP2 family helicase [unclassified Thermococcus]NJE45887.1 IGHMBP2 family helicase [Thermococcus sp. GR7]NJE78778.1 IGHMBP2 family helicase [Thermococcus sp. GR4]NJF22082.1 IGHMBP2 family helicase [Thermococcus sp. GR5]